MICKCLLVLVLDGVGLLAGLDHCVNLLTQIGNKFRYVGNQTHAYACHSRVVIGKHLLHSGDVLEQFGLICKCSRDDMVDSHTANHTALNLNFLGICLPLDLVAGLKFLL